MEGAEAYVNVKQQQERILKRTPCLSTSNNDPLATRDSRDIMRNRIFEYRTHKQMEQLKQWGAIELNPLMWLAI